MTITNILHVTGTKTDLYSSSYFKKKEGRLPINPLTRWADGELIGFGIHNDLTGSSRYAIDLRRVASICELTVTGDDPVSEIVDQLNAQIDVAKTCWMDRPVVPPPHTFINDVEKQYDPTLMNYWLGKYTDYPLIISVDQSLDIKASYGNINEPFMKENFEYRHNLPDAIFTLKKNILNRETTLPICNGLCCYPRIINGEIYASQGARLSYNRADRDRRYVLMDFKPVGGCSFIHLSELDGSLKEFKLPDDFDPENQTVLLVVNGRLFFNGDDFSIVDHHVIFDLSRYNSIHEIDRKLCRGDFEWNSRIIQSKNDQDLYNDDNSFIIVVNRSKLQIVKHFSLYGTNELNRIGPGLDNPNLTIDNVFDKSSRGLLFDYITRSVIDYVREEQTMTFYADHFRHWGVSTIKANKSSLFALLDEDPYNLMSARGFVLDDTRDAEILNHVVWPRLAILDFIFRS